MCERIRPHLEFHERASRLLAALEVPHEVGTEVGPDAAALPSAAWVVDPAV